MNNPSNTEQFVWKPQPDAARIIQILIDQFTAHCPRVNLLDQDLLNKTGTRFSDWVESICVPASFQIENELIESACESAGFQVVAEDHRGKILDHQGAIFPCVCVGSATWQLTIQVENVACFLLTHQLMNAQIVGDTFDQYRKARISQVRENGNSFEIWVAERHGISRYSALQLDEARIKRVSPEIVVKHAERFLLRDRDFENNADGFARAQSSILEAISDLGVDWACDLFFAAEREYWQSRNHAARIQKLRQDVLGMGWANHDHHTYRCSRRCFANLIETLELLGFQCRERFYAGEQTGWGAQVLEQPVCGIVIFADVDLLPGEVEGDFAHQGLAPASELGTVGLWCALHGEAFLQAGMHHLECQFDFDAARKQLAEVGVETMEPFTDFPILRQAFTEPEIWKVSSERITSALESGFIDQQQAAKFSREGVVGSHLEILERNDGYKGFNQSGISHIIKQTDPRLIGTS